MYDHTLSTEDLKIIENETGLLEQVREAIHQGARRSRTIPNILKHLHALRDEARIAKQEDLPALIGQMHSLRRQADMLKEAVRPDLRAPYFAHMRLWVKGKYRDVLLGYQTFIEPKFGVTIIDWRNAPIAKIFFQHREGDTYVQEFPGGEVVGVLEKRRILTFDEGTLVQILTPEHSLRRLPETGWRREEADFIPQLAGGQGGQLAKQIIGTGQSGRKMPLVAALLDPKQHQVITQNRSKALLVIGGAGCGKTTVALHRLAALNYGDGEFYKPKNMAVVVPERGLIGLIRSLLDELSMTETSVHTFDEWIAERARRIFKKLPRTICESTPPAVIRIKRHPALKSVLPILVEQRGVALARRLDRRLGSGREIYNILKGTEGPSLMARLKQTEKKFCQQKPSNYRNIIRKAFNKEFHRLNRVQEDLKNLLGDRGLLLQVAADSKGAINQEMVEELITHSRMQFARRTEKKYAHVDRERLRTIDGKEIDEGTPEEVAGTIDVEDYALLFEILRLKTGALDSDSTSWKRYNHLVIDEAQDLAPLELSLLGNALGEKASLTVAGDHAQKIDRTAPFTSWEDVLEHLDAHPAEEVQLKTTYRCTASILDFAYGVLGPLAPAQKLHAPKQGVPVSLSLFHNEGHRAIFINEALAALKEREPHANVAIIARDAGEAMQLDHTLRESLASRLVLMGDFEFRSGIDITEVSQVKGLEFDYVLIPDARREKYPDTHGSRRLMHVAATRAIHQLWVIAVGARSPLLAGLDQPKSSECFQEHVLKTSPPLPVGKTDEPHRVEEKERP